MDGHQASVSNGNRIPLWLIASEVLFLLLTSCRNLQPPPPPPSNPINWTVTVGPGATYGTVTFSFSEMQNDNRCNLYGNTPDHNRGDITLCPGDTVQWIVANHSSHELVVFVPDKILDQRTFATWDGDQNPHRSGVINATLTGRHDYFVALFDRTHANDPNAHMYHDDRDPVIIVGGR